MTNTHRHIPQHRRLTVLARNWRPVLWAQRSNHYTSSCGGFKKGCRLLTLNGGMVTIPGQRHCECCSIRSPERKCEGVKYAFCYLSGLHHHQFTKNCTASHKRRNHNPYIHIIKSRIKKVKSLGRFAQFHRRMYGRNTSSQSISNYTAQWLLFHFLTVDQKEANNI